jgi:hypothetical protein
VAGQQTRRTPGATGSRSIQVPAVPGVRVPISAGDNLIESGADYLNLFDGTPLEHLSIVPPGMEEQPDWPPNRSDFTTRDAAWARALELVTSNDGLGTMYELLYFSRIETNNLQARGTVHYFRGRGSTAFVDKEGAHGNVVAIVEHPVDPVQPPHFHVVRPPSAFRP